jgi:hypothetical protein
MKYEWYFTQHLSACVLDNYRAEIWHLRGGEKYHCSILDPVSEVVKSFNRESYRECVRLCEEYLRFITCMTPTPYMDPFWRAKMETEIQETIHEPLKTGWFE